MARRHHANPSSIDPAANVRVPNEVPVRPVSRIIRASTGKAVMDIAAPKNNILCQVETPAEKNSGLLIKKIPSSPPSKSGARTPANETEIALRRRCG
jgi:hypothetical protein